MLMNNLDQVDELQKKVAESAGSASKKFNEVYSKSTSARINDMKHSMEQFYNRVFNSSTINHFVDGISNVIQFFTQLTKTSTLTKVAFLTLIPLTIIITKNFIGMALAISDTSKTLGLFEIMLKAVAGAEVEVSMLTKGFATLKAVMIGLFTTPAGLIFLGLATAVGVATGAIIKHINHQKDLKQETDSLRTSFENLTTAMKENDMQQMKSASSDLIKKQKELQDLIQKRAELEEKIRNAPAIVLEGGRTRNGDIQAQTELANTEKQIKEITKTIQDAGGQVDSITGKIDQLATATQLVNLNDQIDKINKTAQARKEEDKNTMSLIDRYMELNSVQNKSKAQEQEMSNLANQLADKNKDLKVSVDEHGNATIKNTELLGKQKDALDLDIQVTNKDTQAKIDNAINSIKFEYNNTQYTLKQVEARIKAYEAETDSIAMLEKAKKGNVDLTYVPTNVQRMLVFYDTIKSNIDKIKNDVNNIGSGDYALPNAETGGGGFMPEGGSSSSSTQSKVSDLQSLTDRYYTLNLAIQKTTDALSQLNKEESSATDKDKITILSKEIELLKTKKLQYQQLFEEQQKDRIEQKKTLYSQGVKFNANGEITNYNSLLQKMTEQANKLAGDSKKNAIENVKAVKQEMDDYTTILSKTLVTTGSTLEDITQSIEDKQKVISDTYKKISEDAEKSAEEQAKAYEDSLNKVMALRDKIVTALEKSYNDQEQAELNSIEKKAKSDDEYYNDLIKKNDEEKKRELDNLDEKAKAQDKYYNDLIKKNDEEKKAKLDTLDAEEKSTQAYFDNIIKTKQAELDALRDDTADKKSSLDAKKAELAKWEKDDSVLAVKKVAELKASIAKDEKDLAISQKEQEIKDLQDQQSKIKDSYDERRRNLENYYADVEEKLKEEQSMVSEAYNQRRQTLEKYYDTVGQKLREAQQQTANSYEAQKTTIENYYKTLLDNAGNLANSLVDDVKNNQNQIIDILMGYEDQYKLAGDTLGKAFADAITQEVQDAVTAAANIQGGGTGSGSGGSGGSNSNHVDATINGVKGYYDMDAFYASAEYKRIEQAFLDAHANGDVDKYNELQQEANKLKQKYWHPYKKGGEVNETGFQWLDGTPTAPERVLDPQQTKDFGTLTNMLKQTNLLSNLKGINNFANLIPSNFMTKIPELISNKTHTQSQNVNVNNNINVTNNTPFDVDNNLDNINRSIKKHLGLTGVNTPLMI